MATMQHAAQPEPHSPAWIAQTWISFAVSVGACALGIWVLPVDPWIRGYLAMGLLFVLGSTLNLAKTARDQHEAHKLVARVDEARMEKLLAEHNPLK